MGADAVEDGGGIAAEEARDLAEAVGALGMMADAPPDLVSSATDALRAGAPAEVVEQDAARAADVVDELEEIARAERIDEDIGGEVHGGVPHDSAAVSHDPSAAAGGGEPRRRPPLRGKGPGLCLRPAR